MCSHVLQNRYSPVQVRVPPPVMKGGSDFELAPFLMVSVASSVIFPRRNRGVLPAQLQEWDLSGFFRGRRI